MLALSRQLGTISLALRSHEDNWRDSINTVRYGVGTPTRR
jgi:hypothetical protein